MEHTLCCLVCLLHEPELLSFQIIIDEKHGDLILFCTKLGTKHTSDYCRIDTALCLIIFIFLVYYVSSSLTYFRSPIVKMVIFKKINKYRHPASCALFCCCSFLGEDNLLIFYKYCFVLLLLV